MIFAHLIQTASSVPTDASALQRSISTLETEITAVESSSVPWEWLVLFCTLLVLVGVGMELWVIRHDWRDDMESWALADFWALRSPAKPSTRKLLVEITSVLFIATGVAGELGIGLKITFINGLLRTKNAELRTKSDQLVGLLQAEAGQAQERAAKIEASMTLRRLTNRQGDALCSALPTDFILGNVLVASSSQDWESFRYAQDFDGALRRCMSSRGLNPSDRGGVGNSFWGQNVPFGIRIRYMKHLTLDDPKSTDLTFNPSKRRALAEHVRKVLEANGVKIDGVSDDGRAVLEIYVGPKEPPKIEPSGSGDSTPTTSH